MSPEITPTTSRDFPWERFWSPRGTPPSLQDGGYLTDPDTQWGRSLNPGLMRFSEVTETRCAVLLGEPGLGKTTALDAESEAIQSQAQSRGDEVWWIRLQEYGSEERLSRRLFESDQFRSWVNGDKQLHLFLDSLDESRLLIRNVAAYLGGELSRPELPIERLWLRIACRAADWPVVLQEALQNRWGSGFRAFELAPLRRKDVVIAADQS